MFKLASIDRTYWDADEKFNNHIISLRLLIQIISLACFVVASHWGVWDNGLSSIGLNTTAMWLGIIYLLTKQNSFIHFKLDWTWLVPLLLVALSFSLYENPWLKKISLFVLPLCVVMFFSFGHTHRKFKLRWNLTLVSYLCRRFSEMFSFIAPSFILFQRALLSLAKGRNLTLLAQIWRATLILIPLLCVVIFLLSSADQKFSDQLTVLLSSFAEFLEISIFYKAVWVVLFSVLTLTFYFALRCVEEAPAVDSQRAIDEVVAGIVLSGVLVIYLVFLKLQLDYLLVDSLPIDFDVAERMVKSGFWQLFFLSAINVGLFYWAYKATGKHAQRILRVYVLASTLILLSGCWRISLYVYYYGLSYEKFFALYTALYALVLFGFLIWAIFCFRYKDIIRFVAFSALWGFALVTTLPIDRLIFNTNVYLVDKAQSRIELGHLRVLSVDALRAANNAIEYKQVKQQFWQSWIHLTAAASCRRAWYEVNLSMLVNCREMPYEIKFTSESLQSDENGYIL